MAEDKEFYVTEEITPAMLRGTRREIKLRQRQILEFAEIKTHSDEEIKVDVFMKKADKFASIVGFTDPSIGVGGVEFESERVSPFHIRNHYDFNTKSKFVSKSGGQYMIAAEGIAHATEELEDMRLNLYVWALMSMINDKQFAYVDDPDDPEHQITVGYSEYLHDLDPAANLLGGGSFDPYKMSDNAKLQFRDRTGQMPNIGLMGSKTAVEFKAAAGVKETMRPQAPDQPDLAGTSFEWFDHNGIRYYVLHDQYPAIDGTMNDAIEEGFIAYTVSRVANVEGYDFPLVFHKAENIENEENALEPYYDQIDLSNNPWTGGTRLYDNLIPHVAKKDIISKKKIYDKP